MIDDLAVDDNGCFQIPSEESAGLTSYLRDNKVPCDLQEANAFRAEGRLYHIVRLRHLYDMETVRELYTGWRRYEAVRRHEAERHG